MKKYIFIITAALFGFAFASCTDEPTYEPGPQADGIQYYFSKDEPAAVTIAPATKSISVDVFRIETSGATTVNVGVSDPSGLICSESSVPVSFTSGSNKASLTIPFDNTKLEYGVDYPVVFTISDNTTPYGVATTTVTYNYPIPLTSLGKCTFYENWFWPITSTPEILQSDIDPNSFVIRNPFAKNGVSSTLNITLCQPGNTYDGVAVTQSGLVWYEPCNTGHYDYYDADVYLLHPSNFSAGATETYWTFNKVVEYQENGLPAIIQLAPYYYMYGVGGWNQSQKNDYITIVFPGVVIKDYSIAAEYAGMFTDPDGNVFGEANVETGGDVESVVAVLVAGDSEAAISAALDTLQAGGESVVTVDGSSVRIPLPENATTGKYSIVVASVGGGELQEYDYATFFYQAGTVDIDWDWLVGNWEAQDESGGDPYPMTVTKKDETTAIFSGIWGMEGGDIEGVVDFDAKTVTFKGPFDIGELYGGRLMIAHAGEDGYDDGEFVATMSASGITITGMGYYLVGGDYDGYDFGTDTTKMTKAE